MPSNKAEKNFIPQHLYNFKLKLKNKINSY
jgi:hypothetical protein